MERGKNDMKTLRSFVLLLAVIAVGISLCACRQDDSQYISDKEACFAFISDNQEKLERLRSEMAQYGCSMNIYTDSDGSLKTSVYGSLYNDREFLRKIKATEAYDLALELLRNEYVDSISILWHRGAVIADAHEADNAVPEIVVHFVSIRKGYFCTASDTGETQQYAEHITGDWYYEENVGE